MDQDPVEILLVEDDTEDLVLAMRQFTAMGMAQKIKMVRHGAAALDYLLRQGEFAGLAPGPAPRLIILDLHLPMSDGIDILKRLKKEPTTKHIPVVLFSSSTSDKDMSKAYGAGAAKYVVKPVKAEDYFAAVRSIGNMVG